MDSAEAAIQSWNKVLEAAQLTPKLVEELARLHIEGRRSAEALEAAEYLSRQAGWEARGLMMLGIIKSALKDVRGADDAFRARSGSTRPRWTGREIRPTSAS